MLVKAIKSGTFDVEAWQAATAKANAADFDQVLAMIRAQEAEYANLLGVVDRGRLPRFDRDVRPKRHARRVAARTGAQWLRGLPHAVVLLSEVRAAATS